ncbi:MAG: FKBP-type peptidyl-prolyl cis-trans isomerase [Candidatus Altiarchaeota archaeon]|nr:FKBP-type peptidyl-prolyl cis-trans isomerase [Candidatus Altiarchaeota archaeon]
MTKVKAIKRKGIEEREERIEESKEHVRHKESSDSGLGDLPFKDKFSWIKDKEIPLSLSILILAFLALRMLIVSEITSLLFTIAAIATTVLLFVLTFYEFGGFKKNKLNFIAFFFGLLLLWVMFQYPDLFLIILFSVYLVLSILWVYKIFNLQLAIIIMLLTTAIIFRVFPAFPDANPGGYLISFDDPYYHYKHTNNLYTTGDFGDRDMLIYPPDGRAVPKKFSYFLVAFLAQITGTSLQTMILLYPVLVSAIGAVFAFLFMKELTSDWKAGLLAGFFFATMPMLLTKSVAGAVEEDVMGMVMGLIAMYLLIKAFKSEGQKNLIFSVLSGLAFFITLLSWKGAEFLFFAPFVATGLYFAIAAILGILLKKEHNSWCGVKATAIAGIIFLIGNALFTQMIPTMKYSLPVVFAIFLGLWAEMIRTADMNENLKRLIAKILGLIVLAVIVIGGLWIFTESADLVTIILLLGGLAVILALVSILLAFINSIKAGFKIDLNPKNFERSVQENLPLVCVLFLGMAVLFVFYIGIDIILNAPAQQIEEFAGTSPHNFLVDKTIQEQAALASGGLIERFSRVYSRFGISEILALFALPMVGLFGLFLFLKRDLDKLKVLILASSFSIAFFIITNSFVWVEARLGFSQSLGFIFLGSMVGIFLPNSKKELETWKIIVFLALLVIPLVTFYPHDVDGQHADSWRNTKMGSSVPEPWVASLVWLYENVPRNDVDPLKGDYVLTWWDYGHAITALSKTPVVADPLQSGEDYIMQIARFFYNTTTEEEAMDWLINQPWNRDQDGNGKKVRYVILDKTLVDKASALAFLGTNYYEIPTGNGADNGTCTGEEILCKNKQLGIKAEKRSDGTYYCSEGVVCNNDIIQGTEERMCCEPDACCEVSFNWRVITQRGGSSVLLRRPTEPVYGQYFINTEGAACKPEYKTSLDPIVLIENGQRRTVVQRLLYTGYGGLEFGDGVRYDAFVVLAYDDNTERVILLTQNCRENDYNEILRSYPDRLAPLEFGARVGGSVVPQIFLHVPAKWTKNMFTELYINNGKDLKYFQLIINDQIQKDFFPYIKIFKVTYPDELPEPEPEPEPVPGVVNVGDTVTVEYTGRFENGTVFDTNVGGQPFEFIAGIKPGMVIQGFDEAVLGMRLGEAKTVTIPPEKAYGLEGESIHELAGKTLVFDIRLLSINEDLEPEPEPVDKTYDVYDPTKTKEYGIKGVPTVVWNCKYTKEGSLVLGEGTEYNPGVEKANLMLLSCIFNQAAPEELCKPLGVVKDENGTIRTTGGKELLVSLGKTGLDSCKPTGKTALEVFYSPSCPDCDAQRSVVEEVAGEFGGSLEVTYYCVADSTEKDGLCRQGSKEVRI